MADRYPIARSMVVRSAARSPPGRAGPGPSARLGAEGAAEDRLVAVVPAARPTARSRISRRPSTTRGWSPIPSLPRREHGHRGRLQPGVGVVDPGPADERRVVAGDLLRVVGLVERPPLLAQQPVRGGPDAAVVDAERVPVEHRVRGHPAGRRGRRGDADRAVGPLHRRQPVGRLPVGRGDGRTPATAASVARSASPARAVGSARGRARVGSPSRRRAPRRASSSRRAADVWSSLIMGGRFPNRRDAGAAAPTPRPVLQYRTRSRLEALWPGFGWGRGDAGRRFDGSPSA